MTDQPNDQEESRGLAARDAQLLALFPGDVELDQEDDAICAKCRTLVSVDPDCEWEAGHSVCHPCAQEAYAAATALLASRATGAEPAVAREGVLSREDVAAWLDHESQGFVEARRWSEAHALSAAGRCVRNGAIESWLASRAKGGGL